MPKRLKKPSSDPNIAAHALISRIAGEDTPTEAFKSQLSRYMSELGRRGGQISGAKRKQNLSPEQRRDIASKAARAMWKKKKAAKKR